MRTRVFAESVLLLLLLLDAAISHTKHFAVTMGAAEDDWDGTVGAHSGAVDMEHEQVRCRCEQQWRLGSKDV